MARINKEILGEINGKLGNMVFRQLNGKTVMSVRPPNYKPAKTKAAKSARSKFAISVYFAKFINSIPNLKKVWNSAKISGTNSNQKIIKHNIKLIGEGILTHENIITPVAVPLLVENLSFDETKISFTLNLKDRNIKQAVTLPFQIHAVLYFYDPANEKEKPFTLDSILSNVTSPSAKDLYSIQLDLNDNQISLFKKYNKQIIYIAAVSDVVNNKSNYWTSTYAAALNG